jgi:beta-glucanase (GH16 family)
MKGKLRVLMIIVVLLVIGTTIITCFTTAGKNDDKKFVFNYEDYDLIFSEDFEGTSLDSTRWDYDYNQDRQGGSSWRDDMISVGDGFLHIKFKRDPSLGKGENWIRSGAIRTCTRNEKFLFTNTFGYYAARIKFPVVPGTWGAFWLMSPTQGSMGNGGRDGTEIDIIETIGNAQGRYNAALHWDGYPSQNISSAEYGGSRPVNIYDGEFHVFALEWKQNEYIFYVDDIVFWRVDGGASFNNCGINQTPNYIILSVEAAEYGGWAGTLPANFTESEMLVDYVRVYRKK